MTRFSDDVSQCSARHQVREVLRSEQMLDGGIHNYAAIGRGKNFGKLSVSDDHNVVFGGAISSRHVTTTEPHWLEFISTGIVDHVEFAVVVQPMSDEVINNL